MKSETIPVSKFLCIPQIINDQPALYMNYLRGKHANFLSNQQLENTACLMAKFHQIRLNNLFSIKNITIYDYIKLFKVCNKFKYLSKIKKIFYGIDLNYLNKLKLSLIHGDFSLSNLFFDTSGKIIGLIDYDHSCYSYSLTDIARSQIFFAFDEKLYFNEQSVINFIKKYIEIIPINKSLELQYFFWHMKILLIKMILETYYYVKVKREVSEKIFQESHFNQSPLVLYRKLLAIENKKSLDISQ